MGDAAGSAASGMSGALLRSSEQLTAMGHHVNLLFREDLLSARCPQRLRRLVVPLAVVVRVRRLHRDGPLDVAEVHEPLAGPYAFLAATAWGRRHLPPCVVLSHGLEERCWKTTRRCRAATSTPTSLLSRVSVPITLLGQARLGLRRATHVIVLNRNDRDELVEGWGLPPETVSIVANGVEPELLTIDRRPADGSLRVLFLGSWLERKGVGELVRAWPVVHHRFPSARLSLVGVGSAAGAAAFAAAYPGSVTTVPSVSREALPELLADHDVLVLPSWFEGMPLVVLEAAAGGLAVVATEIPGVVDIFRPPDPERDGGVLVGCTDPSALGAALCRVAADPDLLARLQRAARRRVSNLTWASSAAGLAAAYGMARGLVGAR